MRGIGMNMYINLQFPSITLIYTCGDVVGLVMVLESATAATTAS